MPRGKPGTRKPKTSRPDRKLNREDAHDQVQAYGEIVNAKAQGRATVYERGMDVLAENYALLGLTEKEIAGQFGIDLTTLGDWKRRHPSLARAIRAGGIEADALVGKRTFERALGYSHADTHICSSGGKVFQTPITKHYPPDVQAAIFWLANRQRTRWSRDGIGANGRTDEEKARMVQQFKELIGFTDPPPSDE